MAYIARRNRIERAARIDRERRRNANGLSGRESRPDYPQCAERLVARG